MNAPDTQPSVLMAPPAGALFQYGMDSFGKEPARYRVTGWMRFKRQMPDALDFAMSGATPGEYGGRVALLIAEVVRDAPREGPGSRADSMEFCLRELATHVCGAGIAGCIAPI